MCFGFARARARVGACGSRSRRLARRRASGDDETPETDCERARRAANPELKEKDKEQQRARRADPEYRKKRNAQERARRAKKKAKGLEVTS